ncbi:MAG: glutamine--tRNA ligase/YqeY domain fusion protein [Verrucomicrobiota bacterium]
MSSTESDAAKPEARADFIREIIAKDIADDTHGGAVVTRFPPEPNGYLHIGHAKSICLNFGISQEGEGRRCHLRFDDTNPTKESPEFVESIKRDIQWLGFDWGEHLYFASDYFDQLYEWAVLLIKEGKAYVDDSTPDEIRESRGTLTEAGTPTPFRDRSVEENLDLFERMRAGEFPDGACVLRAKIDLASPNMNLRDPVMYRILHAEHHRTGDKWKIYPNYDFTHGQSDAIENITHSICTLEFENHRPLYDWFIENLPVPSRPRQYEFARLNLNYTVMSKRKFIQLVDGGHVSSWDDPRMPTISGMRRLGYTPEAIRDLCATVGVTKFKSVTDFALLEHAVRQDLNRVALRKMVVLRPLRVVIENFDELFVTQSEAINNPEDESAGKRPVELTREFFIEQDDFMEDPPRKFFRLGPGREVRLRYSYCFTCKDFEKDEEGNVTLLRGTVDPETLGKNPEGRKVKGAIHWVSADQAIDAEVRLYDRLFNVEAPDDDFVDQLNPNSLEVLQGAKLEPSLAGALVGERYQFERNGYFCVDPDSSPEALVFNRTITLKDSWAKIAAKR